MSSDAAVLRWGCHSIPQRIVSLVKARSGSDHGKEMFNPYDWRQRREDTMRETQQIRLARALGVDPERRANHAFLTRWEMGRMAGLLLKFIRRLKSRKGACP